MCVCVCEGDVRCLVHCTLSDICRLLSIREAESASPLAAAVAGPDSGEWHHTQTCVFVCVCLLCCIFIPFISNDELPSENWWVVSCLSSFLKHSGMFYKLQLILRQFFHHYLFRCVLSSIHCLLKVGRKVMHIQLSCRSFPVLFHWSTINKSWIFEWKPETRSSAGPSLMWNFGQDRIRLLLCSSDSCLQDDASNILSKDPLFQNITNIKVANEQNYSVNSLFVDCWGFKNESDWMKSQNWIFFFDAGWVYVTRPPEVMSTGIPPTFTKPVTETLTKGVCEFVILK